MTPPPLSPRRSVRLGILVLLLLLVALLVAPTAQAGGDDFEFGKKLAAERYFDYARKVFDAILADRNRSEEDKDEARYGLALLQKEEALAAAARADVPYKELLALFDGAANDIQAFVEKNPTNKNSAQARLDVGQVRLAFVQWARELLDDPEAMKEWDVDANRLSDDAKIAIDKAISYFKGLRPKEGARKVEDYQQLASYYYVISQYFRALVEAPCSPAAMSALQAAGNDIEEYIMDHDGQLLAVYAQDIYGLVWWEMAKCEGDPEKKISYYNKAFEWFETCIYTDDQGPDYLRVITSGFYHIAQAGLDADRSPDRNFAKDALGHLEEMLDRHPTSWRTDNGLRALVEQSKLECARGNTGRAVEVALDAAERANKAGKPHLERLANRQLNVYVSGGCGGSVTGMVDPGVLRRVADDLFIAAKYTDAIRAYRAVIGASADSVEAFVEHGWHAWERMAAAYNRLEDRLGEALAYEPIHDAWIRGVIPREPGKEDDPNLVRAGNNRRAAQVALKELADRTGSGVMEARYKLIRDKFLTEYVGHPSGQIGEYNAARDRWRQAFEQRSKNDPRWKGSLKEARKHFRNLTKESRSEKQDLAWVYLVRCDYEEQKFAEAVQTAKEGFTFWDSPEAKAQAEKFASIRQRRHGARGEATYWMARSLEEQGKAQEAVAALEGWHTEYPDLKSPYPELAYDLLVQANLETGDIQRADTWYRTLLSAHPKYRRLGAITFLLADHYNEKRGLIEKELREVTIQLNTARRGKTEAGKEALRLASLLADLKSAFNKNLQKIEYRKAELAKGVPDRDINVTEGDVRQAEEENKELSETRIPEVETGLKVWAPKRDGFTADFDRLIAEKEALEQKLYDPLTKAAGYYKEWDDSLKRTEQRRDPENVGVFAQLFWTAGRLRPDEIENWRKARMLFEDYFAFKAVQDKPPSDPDKRNNIGRLGDVYVNLAEQATDAEKRRELVTLAVDRLQSSVANRVADNPIVVGMLGDQVLVLNWRDGDGDRWRFPIPKPATVGDLRDSVTNMGKEGGIPLPEFDDDMAAKKYKDALRKFRTKLGEKDDKDLESFVGGEKSTFDPILYKDLANTDKEFRLALAWAYSETGRETDVAKALNLALSLLKPPLGVEDDTPEWWRAALIQMRLYMRTAERKLATASDAATATSWLERAGKVFAATAAIYPELGKSVIKGNHEVWVKLRDDLNALRARAGMLPVDVNLAMPVPAEDDSEKPADDGEE